MLVPLTPQVGITTVSLGLATALEQCSIATAYFKPVGQGVADEDRATGIANDSGFSTVPPMDRSAVERWIGGDAYDDLLEAVIATLNTHAGDARVIVLEGLAAEEGFPYANRLNMDIGSTLGADVVFVGSPGEGGVEALLDLVDVGSHYYRDDKGSNIAGCIVNRFRTGVTKGDGTGISAESVGSAELRDAFRAAEIPLLGLIPWYEDLQAARVIDLARHLGARVDNEEYADRRRIRALKFCSSSLASTVFEAGDVIIVPGDREDIIVGAALATMNGVELAAIVLSDGLAPSPAVNMLCEGAVESGLPILVTDGDTWETARRLRDFNRSVPRGDFERIQLSREFAAGHIDRAWIEAMGDGEPTERRLSPPAFRHMLARRAGRVMRRIVLPEGDEPRTIKAAVLCRHRGIADCVLLGEREQITRIARQHGIDLPDELEIRDPGLERGKYIERLVELRSSKGVTALSAEEQLQDNIVLGTMMLEQGDVDGLVAGAVSTTANTIRPALQLIKTDPCSSLVSSVFFMLLPEQVLVYGDCAINPDPDAEQLADIAIQSADSAATFGIAPRVAMISYSTGSSGSGAGVDKVREATDLVRQRRPDIIVDGPMQYDAAVMESVARTKLPESPVAGRATVLVFPDLNTGNTTYKAVQRSANLISIGPMLQGLNKPVNDLSRGALVDDIVYTIALTAIQASNEVAD
jgi:phosphate acetyltransferase